MGSKADFLCSHCSIIDIAFDVASDLSDNYPAVGNRAVVSRDRSSPEPSNDFRVLRDGADEKAM